MNSSVLGASIAAVAGIISAVIALLAARGARISAERVAEAGRKSQLDVERLRADMAVAADESRRRLDADHILNRYSEPLAGAAFDLALRLDNIINSRFFAYLEEGSARREETVDSTLFRICQFFGWKEVLRQRIQFLGFVDAERSRNVSRIIADVSIAWSTERRFGHVGMIWHDSQRAIGELMTVRDEDGISVLGFAAFRKKLPELAPYLVPVKALLDQGHQAFDTPRFHAITGLLNDLVLELDPDERRFFDRRYPDVPLDGVPQ